MFTNDKVDKNDLEKSGNHSIRYASQVATTTTHLHPEMLPPTKTAVKHHTFRTYVKGAQYSEIYFL